MSKDMSITPDEKVTPLQDEVSCRSESDDLKINAQMYRDQGCQVVAVQGLGFVGSAVAAAVASSRDMDGTPLYYVIGVDLPTIEGYRKVVKLNQGEVPVGSSDPELSKLTSHAVLEVGNLQATSSEEAYSLADIVIVDVPLDIADRTEFDPTQIDVELDGFKAAIKSVGCFMQSDALVLVETTVPFGVSEEYILPILRRERSQRGISEPVQLAHSYERVMPGSKHISSIRQNWRTFAGVDRSSAEKARRFLSSFIDTEAYPLTELEDIKAAELAKLLENSYRVVNIALIHEWTLLAEQLGLNLFAIIDSIRVRKGTHDNIRYPGFGVGGYCLPKDPLLAQWSSTRLQGSDIVLQMTLDAMRINYNLPLHSVDLLRELSGNALAGKTIGICGISYLPDVADTRNSPAELLVDELLDAGANVIAHDPSVDVWPERPTVELVQDLARCLAEVDGVIFGVRHREYSDLDIDILANMMPQPLFIVDASDAIPDEKAQALHRAGYRLLGIGKGHWRKLGFQIADQR